MHKYYDFIRTFIMELGGIQVFVTKMFGVLKDKGMKGVIEKIRHFLQHAKKEGNVKIGYGQYKKWLKKYYQLSDEELRTMQMIAESFSYKPKISVIMPTYNSSIKWLEEAIESVRKQVYPNWELCIADDASANRDCKELLKKYHKHDKRIKVVFRSENGHISAASNSALEIATGEWIALLDHDDIFPVDALFCVAKAINNNPKACLFYSDEDKIDYKGRRQNPYFKCDWNYHLFLSQNMISHLGVYKTEIIREIGGFRTGFEGSQDYDLALRFIEKISDEQIVHIPRVLYHWRIHQESTSLGADKKPYALISGKRAINEHLIRTGKLAKAGILDNGMYRVKYNLPEHPPLVSIIIPTKNNKVILENCLTSIIAKIDYPNYEILIVDNNSDDEATLLYLESLSKNSNIRILHDTDDFNFSAINNKAVKSANGSYICFLNDDTEVISPNWLSEMVSICIQQNIGAVGARLWYPNDTLQHGGVILGIGGIASHAHKFLPKYSEGYFNRAGLIQEFSAVTAACMVVSKDIFNKVGGFNETQLSVAYNDVDLCLKISNLGYSIVWTPFTELYHYESISRGADIQDEKKQRILKETDYMNKKWGGMIRNDPAYSPNLTLDTEDFSLAWPPRVDFNF